MDTTVAGLNKVLCFTNNSDNNGKTVTITDGINTWSDVLSDLSCVFMIPSMPAPAKRAYTVTLYDGDATQDPLYTRTIELGFGDSIKVGLYSGDEIVTKEYYNTNMYTLPSAGAATLGGVMVNSSSSGGLYMNGSYLVLAAATSSQQGGVKLGTNMTTSNSKIEPYNIEYGTSSKTSGSSSLTTGRIYCQYE